MYLKLRDVQFPVKRAVANAIVGEKSLLWSVDVEMEEGNVEDSFASPRFYADGLVFDVYRWAELKGKSILLEAPFSDFAGPRAATYFWGHEPIPRSELTFVEKLGRDFLVRWEGICDPYWAEPFEANVPFLIEAQMTFTQFQAGIQGQQGNEKIIDWLSNSLDLRSLLD